MVALDKSCAILLKELSKRDMADYDTIVLSRNKKFSRAETILHLVDNGLIETYPPIDPDARITYRITIYGKSILQDYLIRYNERLWTRGLAIAAIIISVIALLKQ